MTTLAPRALRPEDLPGAAALHATCFPEEPWSAESLAGLLAQPGVCGWLLEGEGGGDPEPIALLLARVAADEAEVLTLCVAPASRRGGHARALLRGALPILAALGARRLLLEVAEDNAAARALYEREGFLLAGRRPEYYSRRRGGAADALLLLRELA